MVDKKSRAARRHHCARLKVKRQFHWGYGKEGWRDYCNIETRGEILTMSPVHAGMVVNTPTPCSCYMCGNPRRNSWADNPLTMQERKALDAYNDGIEEYELTKI